MADLDGAGCSPLRLSSNAQTPRSPVGLGTAHLEQLHLDCCRHLVRAMRRPMRKIRQALQSVRFVARQPRVHRLPADTPVARYLGNRPPFRNHRHDRLVPLLSHAHLPHARECQASAGTPVRHQPKPRQPSGGTLLSCFSRISTQEWLRSGDSNPEPCG